MNSLEIDLMVVIWDSILLHNVKTKFIVLSGMEEVLTNASSQGGSIYFDMEVSPYRSLMIFIDLSTFIKDSPIPPYSNN